jgi:hypothetical protein
VLEQRLLAVPEDELALYNAVNSMFKGGTKPMVEDIELGSDMMQGTLYWRSSKTSATGHLAQGMEIVDRDTQHRSFTWVAPLSSTWPPPLTLSTEVADNMVWDFRLQEGETGHSALFALAEQLDKRYCGAFFAKVCTNI